MTATVESFGGGAYIGGLYVQNPNVPPIPPDSMEPDNQTTIWPRPHDPKIDTIEVIRQCLLAIGLEEDEFGISKDGSFRVDALKNSKGQVVPFIVVTRTGDREKRYGIGKHFGNYTQNDVTNGVIEDDGDFVGNLDVLTVRGAISEVTLAVDIFDVNVNRIDQMYLIVKYILEAALEQFKDIGYIEFKRVNGVDSTVIPVDDDGVPYQVLNRTLTYEAWVPSFIDTIQQSVMIVKQTLLLNPKNPAADEPETTNL